MYDISRIRWLLFLVWLRSDCSGMLPGILHVTLGPVERLLHLARQVAAAVDHWLLALLVERQHGQPAAGISHRAAHRVDALQEEWSRPFLAGEVRLDWPWLKGRLEAELLRLVRLTIAPSPAFAWPGWLEWEVRYWALAMCLARLGQLYGMLERWQGREPAQDLLEEVARLIWQQGQK